MASIDLPRALQDYFAFAETAPTRNGRRFSITLPYVRPDGRLDRLQWWYHLSPAKEMALGDNAVETLRAEAIERFSTHIERWLHNTRQDLFGDGSIPYVGPEGNRVVTAYRVDPAASEGLQETAEETVDPLSAEPLSVGDHAAEVQETGGATPESDHHPANKTAFG
jgi:hypothetical protein